MGKMRIWSLLLLLLLAVSCGGGAVTSPYPLTYISVTPADASLPVGATKQFAAQGINSDGSTRDLGGNVTWRSSNPAVATISTTGLATAVAPGTAAITATSGNVSGSTNLTVTSATLSSLSVIPGAPDRALEIRETRDPSPMSVSAGWDSNPAGIPVGARLQLAARGTFADGMVHDMTLRVEWISSNPAVAGVDENGLAAALAPGVTTIMVKFAGIEGTLLLNVNSAADSKQK